jgi:hypothetical protein
MNCKTPAEAFELGPFLLTCTECPYSSIDQAQYKRFCLTTARSANGNMDFPMCEYVLQQGLYLFSTKQKLENLFT